MKMESKKKEVLFGIGVVALMLGIGVYTARYAFAYADAKEQAAEAFAPYPAAYRARCTYSVYGQCLIATLMYGSKVVATAHRKLGEERWKK